MADGRKQRVTVAKEKSNLALNGGYQAKNGPYGVAKRFLNRETVYLREALRQNTLFSGFGKQVEAACRLMSDYTGLPYVIACSSGSAAVHLGLIAGGVGPGDEVVCTPNTDSGSVLGIIAEGAVPVFCDCEENLQPSAETVAACITDRTRAVVAVHLAGCPAPVDEIVALCRPRGIAVIEDCAQSWGTRLRDRPVGTFGTAGCFSLNDDKHLSCGDGGFVALTDETLYRRVVNYADTHDDRPFGGELRQPHHGINYRMTELQGAVARAQIEKLDEITAKYHKMGEYLLAAVKELPGVRMTGPPADSYATYWRIGLIVDPERLSVDRDKVVRSLRAEGVPAVSYGNYDLIGTPLFQTRVVRSWLDGDRAMYPFVQPDGRRYHYTYEKTPTHRRLLDTGIQISPALGWTKRDLEETADALRKVFYAYGE